MTRKMRFVPVLCGFLFLAGLVLRLTLGGPLLSAELVYKAPGEIHFPGTKTAADAAVSFYMYLDRGKFSKAWEISMEPDFTPDSGPAAFKDAVRPGPAFPDDFTGQDEFVRRQKFELGPGGLYLKLHNIRGELLAENVEVRGVREPCSLVRVSGHMLGACTIFSWEREVPVAHTESGYKIFLPGTKDERFFYYQQWFSNIVKIMDLRATDADQEGRMETVEQSDL